MVGFSTEDLQGLAVLKAQKGDSWHAIDQVNPLTSRGMPRCACGLLGRP